MKQKPKFYFTELAHSLKVEVKNLEALSVAQIVAIEQFVEKRRGVFDFSTYTFVLQKKLTFEEFSKLIQESKLDAIVINNPLKVEAEKRVSFGQYKGVSYSEIPDSYLLWLKSNYHGKEQSYIDAELKKRKL